MKALSHSYVKYSPRVPLVLFTVEKIECENFDFVFSLIHNWKSVLRIWTSYTPNDCTTIRDFPFFGYSFMPAKIEELWLQTHITVAFLHVILCVITCTTQKLKVTYGHSTYQNTALLSEIFVVWVRAVCEVQLVSYGSIHTPQPLSDTTFCVYMYLHSQLENYRLYIDVVHIEWLVYCWRCLFSALELDARYEWRLMAPNTHCSLFLISHLYVLRHITWKLQFICGRSACSLTSILLETFCVT